MSRIVLASASPRRKEILEQIGLEFEVCPAKGQEIITKNDPKEVVVELAKQKAEKVAFLIKEYNASHSNIVTPQDIMVIGADTVVAYENKILGKPLDEDDAKRTLGILSGNTHEVYTGVSIVLLDKSGRIGEHNFYDRTLVAVNEISQKDIDRYLATGESMDKAGSYGIQGAFAIHIKKINGDYNNVVGLPISKIYTELKSIGIDLYLW